jgi:hypothetical protein
MHMTHILTRMIAIGIAILAGGIVLFGPWVTSAATYNYIDLGGMVRSLEANTAEEALALVVAMPNTLHTGVLLDQGILTDGEVYGYTYSYTDAAGTTGVITAESTDAALMLRPNIVADSLTPTAVVRGGEVTPVENVPVQQ